MRAAQGQEGQQIDSYQAGRPWLGPLGELGWHASLCLYELAILGRRRWWWRMHWRLWKEFRGLNPDRLVRASAGPSSLAYGETPALSVATVLRRSGLAPPAVVVDLGCGRGLPLLTAASLGYTARGMDYFARYVDGCRRVAERLGLQVDVRAGHFLDEPWPDGDLYFLCSTAFPDDVREALLEKLKALPEGTRIVTQDWILPFPLLSKMVLPVTWGTAIFHIYAKD